MVVLILQIITFIGTKEEVTWYLNLSQILKDIKLLQWKISCQIDLSVEIITNSALQH